MRDMTGMQRYIVENFEKALGGGWLRVWYQPVIRGSNGRVCSEEALSRWIEPDGAIIYPDVFVPALEEAGLIHMLDLHVVDRIVKDLERRREEGLYTVPVSFNVSRADFELCDMVEEVRKRVDDAGINRDLMTVEITESVLGSDLEQIRQQIGRFRSLGFRVCMDDFGSGYSTLGFLQKTDVDALKLDLNFMREFNSNSKTRLIVTQLVRLISALGMDTIAEGVETEEQFEFLREIGCTKMQGFYFCEAIPIEEILARYAEGRQIGFENPDETEYYETLGRISLFDLDDITSEERDPDGTKSLQKYFASLPVAILEYNGENIRVARCNRSYKDFLRDTFHLDDEKRKSNHLPGLGDKGSEITELMERARGKDRRILFEEKISEKDSINGFIRHSADNPVTGYSAFTIAILSNKDFEDSSGVTFARAARALSIDYINLYYVNCITDEFTEYDPDAEHGNLSVERRGKDFFSSARADAARAVYPQDLERFLAEFTKKNVLEILEQQGTYTLSYRLMKDGRPIYVNMKAVRVDDEHLVIGINDMDAYMRHQEALERAQAERTTYARITALAGNFIAIFTVDPVTDDYVRYTSTAVFDTYGIDNRGTDFFNETLRLAMDTVYAEDLEGFRLVFNKENILRDIRQTGLFELNYRMVMEGKPLHVSLRAAIVEEKDGPRLIVGLNNIEDRIQRSKEYENSLREARAMITTDGLTGVKNKAAYLNAEAELNDEIKLGGQPEFAIVVADLNGLKEINDQHGHQTGDNFLKAGCRAICDIFDHSPVFRVGGDEFAVIVRGRDYEDLDALIEEMAAHNERCIQARKVKTGGYSAAKQMTVTAGSFDRDSKVERDYSDASAGEIYSFDPEDVVIACGMARFEDDTDVAAVFDRADLAMFENKKELKSR
ncbi:MAG: EAL domain-containing protein [Mogibacterium sp.]|nr:EAL domain-containing protein [Mogibacterium sp.]